MDAVTRPPPSRNRALRGVLRALGLSDEAGLVQLADALSSATRTLGDVSDVEITTGNAGAAPSSPLHRLHHEIVVAAALTGRVHGAAADIEDALAVLAAQPSSGPSETVEALLRAARSHLDALPPPQASTAATADGWDTRTPDAIDRTGTWPGAGDVERVRADEHHSDEPSPTAEVLMHLVDRVGTAIVSETRSERMLPWIHDRLVDALGEEGVALIDDVDVRFDPDRHAVVEKEVTTDPAQSSRISASIRPGFAYGDAVVRPQQVVVRVVDE